MDVERLVSGLRAAGELSRLRLLNLLARGSLTVSELTAIMGQSQPRVSRHLKLLSEANLIERLPEGSWVFYRLAESDRDGVSSFVERLLSGLDKDDAVIATDLERLAAVKQTRAAEAANYFAANAGEWNRIRSLHLSEGEVEAAMRAMLGDRPAGLLVDLGTGTGAVLAALSDLYARGIGFDVSHAMLSVARVNLERAHLTRAHVRHGDIFALPVAKASAGTVVLHQVLHYLDDPLGAVRSAARLLEPEGRLLICDFAPHALEFLRTDHAHRRLGFSDDEIARWCGASGLQLTAKRHLPPKDPAGLTVSLWLAVRPQAAAKSLELAS